MKVRREVLHLHLHLHLPDGYDARGGHDITVPPGCHLCIKQLMRR